MNTLNEQDIEIRYECTDGEETSIIDRCIEKLEAAKRSLMADAEAAEEDEREPRCIESYHRYYFRNGVGTGQLVFTQRISYEDRILS